MNLFPGTQLNPQILMATRQVIQVARDIESLLPQALREGSVTVSEGRIRRWQAALQSAVTQLQQIPVILIFPPPPFVRFIGGAIRQINQALDTLAAIPIATTRIFPPQPGRAIISLETLQFLLNDLQEAIALLIRALQLA
jgi:hypothetical protein